MQGPEGGRVRVTPSGSARAAARKKARARAKTQAAKCSPRGGGLRSSRESRLDGPCGSSADPPKEVALTI